MRTKVYLDTSVFSAYYDDTDPLRQRDTEEFFDRLHMYEGSTSSVTLDEIEDTPDASLRSRLMELTARTKAVPVAEDMQALADRYVAAGVFMPSQGDDALHVAVAVLSGQNIIVSWNFRHLVNRRRRALINELNTLLGLPPIEIIAPPEL